MKAMKCYQTYYVLAINYKEKIDTGCIRKHVQDTFKIKNNNIKLNTNSIYYAINIYKVR